jgi:hypothetical protein
LIKEIWNISGHKNVERTIFGIDVDCSAEKVSGRIEKILQTSNEEKVKLIPRSVCILAAI